MNRHRNKIRAKNDQEDYYFVQNTGTRKAIFMVRMLTDQTVPMQKNLYLCFIDYAIAFDKV